MQVISLKHVHSSVQLVDIFTKSLEATIFQNPCVGLGVSKFFFIAIKFIWAEKMDTMGITKTVEQIRKESVQV